MVFSMVHGVFQALTVNALNGDDRERWMRAIADKVRGRDLGGFLLCCLLLAHALSGIRTLPGELRY